VRGAYLPESGQHGIDRQRIGRHDRRDQSDELFEPHSGMGRSRFRQIQLGGMRVHAINLADPIALQRSNFACLPAADI
jgi:hypothetical protein